MKVVQTTAALRNLRKDALWRLLAAGNAPAIVALLKVLLMDTDTRLPTSILHERLTRELELLRASGEDLPQNAQAYLNSWLSEGWVSRHLAPGVHEEEYELTRDGAEAIRFIAGLAKPRSSATESRLATVMSQIARLAEDTDPNPDTRVRRLIEERDQIDREIAAIRTDGVRTLAPDRALERAREIIVLADDLTADFRRVREEFATINRSLRRSLVENEGSRGDVLEAIFAGIDVIGQTDAGRSFKAYWRLLTDMEQSASLQDNLLQITSRTFCEDLELLERRFLLRLLDRLLDEGAAVHDVSQNFARSLKTFVQSREYLEQRRLHSLLKGAIQAALQLRDDVRPNMQLDYVLTLTSSKVRSISQWQLLDPSERVTDPEMRENSPADIDPSVIAAMVKQSEIDFRSLEESIAAALEFQSQATIGQILEQFPAKQGLGTIVGYITIGVTRGFASTGEELVSWLGMDNVPRRARIPRIYFFKDAAN